MKGSGYEKERMVEAMTPEQIFQDTWMVEDEGVRIFILAGTERALVIDTGRTGIDVRGLAAAVTPLPLALLNTHADPDHIAGNGQFASFYMHPSEGFLYYGIHGMSGAMLPVCDGDRMDLGGRPLEILHLPGHTPGSLTVLDRNSRALIGGDAIQRHGRIYMFGVHRDFHSYVWSLRRLLEREDFDCVYASHADLRVPREVIPQLIDGAERVLAGAVPGERITVHGKEIMARDIGENVFLCELP